MVSIGDPRRGAEDLDNALAVSERRSCPVVEMARSTNRRPSGRTEETQLVTEIYAVSERGPRFGHRKNFDRLKWAGWRVGRERVQLLRRREVLRVPQKAIKRGRPGKGAIDPQYAEYPNHVWIYDFVADQTSDGKALRFFTGIDELTRCALSHTFGYAADPGAVTVEAHEPAAGFQAPPVHRWRDFGRSFYRRPLPSERIQPLGRRAGACGRGGAGVRSLNGLWCLIAGWLLSPAATPPAGLS
jgi:hypothetical protein